MTTTLENLSYDIWREGYLLDNIINNLMDTDNQDIDKGKSNKYIVQAVTKFPYFRIKSPVTFFEIYNKDLKQETKVKLQDHIAGCKSKEEQCHKLDGIITEVIAFIYKQAEPLILSNTKYEDSVWVKRAINEIRTTVSYKWRFV